MLRACSGLNSCVGSTTAPKFRSCVIIHVFSTFSVYLIPIFKDSKENSNLNESIQMINVTPTFTGNISMTWNHIPQAAVVLPSMDAGTSTIAQ
jgi:hypothetical protein